jgi:hypothetical protein
MQKIFRFLVLAVIYSISFVLLYSIIPAIVWIFGGSFTAVSQHFAFAFIFGGSLAIGLAVLFGECFNADFYSKL